MPDLDDDIYDAVYQEDDQEIYDDLCSLRRKPRTQVDSLDWMFSSEVFVPRYQYY